MKNRHAPWVLVLAGLLAATLPAAAGSVKVARFWHNHQPIYWPDWADGHVQYAKDSIERKGDQGGHPVDNLTEIFGKYDRVKAYQYGPRDSLGACDSGAGYAISYSGSLIDNVRSLGSAGMLNYDSNPFGGYQDACSWKDWKNNRRMEMVGFCYHHALGPVLPKSVFRKEVQMLKQSAWKAWGNDYESNPSKGFFPTEMAFSEEMIDVLRDEGYEWVIVASHHLSRTCPTYFNNGTADNNYGINSSEPNRADMNGPSPTDGWWYDSPNPGNCAWNVAPFAYQLHKVQYVNPWTGETKQMVAVPSDDVISYKAGYSGAEMKYAEKISYGASDANPVIILPATDGDNAWGGGDSSWMESWPGFTRQAAGNHWDNTTLQSFVDDYKASATLAHVEDGAWIFPEMCYGSPYFLKWVDPPCNPKNIDACYPGTQVDLETPGFALKFWDWAPIIAAANWCETAEKKLGRADAWRIAAPYESSASPNAAEWAWHIYLAGLDSGFNYYGGEGNDDECKPPLANLRAIETLRNAGLDQTTLASTEGSNGEGTPPTMFRPQRFPYNPGAYTFGWFNRTPTDGNFRKKMGSDFYVWTHVYDVSGINDGDVKLWVREDKDGYNPVDSIQNETFAGGDEVGEWFAIPMTKRTLPSKTEDLNALADNGQINYEFEPAAVADYYFAKVTQFRGKLVDYYVEATDSKGNTARSDIQHVWVGDDGTAPGEGGGGASASATFSPASPTDCGDITVTFNAGDGVLKDAAQVKMGYNFTGTDEGWGTVDMAATSVEGTWTYTFAPQTEPFVDNSPSLAVFFTDGNDNYESRGGANWTVTIADCDAPINGVKLSTNPAVAGEAVTVYYYPAGRVLDGAEAVCAHHGYNNGNWTTVPGDAMTWSTFDRAWKYTFTVPEQASTLDFCFNNGGTTWDNNGGDNWTFPVTGTVVPEPWFSGVCAVTNLTEQPYATLEIGYNPAGRDLAVAPAVYVHIGVVTATSTNWTSYPMSNQGGFWALIITPELYTTGYLLCFHDGGTVWDNNGGDNWSFDLSGNYDPVAEGLVITSPTETTTVEEPKATITGTAGSDIVGPITWTNAAAGVGGTFEAISLWSREVPLTGGSNEIVFTAQSISGSSGYAADDAANYEEDDFTGLNKGTNFMPWITVIPTGADGDSDAPDADLAFVVLSPGPKQGCTSTVKFYANNEASALAHGTVENVFVHWGATDAGGNASWTELSGDPMTWVDADGAWEAQIAVPADAVSLSFLFNDGGSTWLHYNDVRGGDQTDWQCEVAPGSAGTQGGVWAEPEGDGFGMWENFGYATKIFRPFGRDLTTNDVFSFTFKNGNIAWYTADTQPGTGAGVCAVDGDTIDENCGFRFYFNGGQEVYETPYGNTTIGWTTSPMTVTLMMADTTNFTASFEISGEVASTVSGAFTKPCNAFRAWSWSNKEDNPENDYDVFVDHLVLGQLVYETQTAKAVLIYGTPGEEIEVVTTGITDSQFDASTGKLALKAAVNAPNGTSIDIYTTDSLFGEDGKQTWMKFTTVVVSEGAVELSGLDLTGASLFISIGTPGVK